MESSTYQRLDSSSTAVHIGESSGPLPHSTELQIGNAIFFILLLLTNVLAASGIFPHTPRSLRHAEPTHLDPADFTFLVWPLIYFLCALFALYQAPPHRRSSIPIFREIHGLFMLSCLLQISWLFCLCYDAPPVVPLLFMAALLATLLAAYLRINYTNRLGIATPIPRYLCVHLLFSVFLAWASLETSLMASWFLREQVHWYGKPWDESGWAVVVLALVALVTMIILFRMRDGVFGLVIAWSCFGVAKAHTHIEEIKIAGYVFGSILLLTSLIALALKYRKWDEERTGIKVRIIQSPT